MGGAELGNGDGEFAPASARCRRAVTFSDTGEAVGNACGERDPDGGAIAGHECVRRTSRRGGAPVTGEPTLKMLLKSFHLPSFAANYEGLAGKAGREGLTYERYLHDLAQLEAYD